ncbi:MAG: TetR/AcrR family transcriptional regulator, partial [Burkholderiales bacterium]
EGARALSLREVARAAGVSHTASYRHFPSKESLFAAIAEQGFHWLLDMMQRSAQASGDDHLARLRACGVAYVEFGVRYPEHLQIMFGGLVGRPDEHPSLMQAAKAAYDLLASTVRAALQSGQARGPDERIVTLAAWALVHGLTHLIAGGQIRVDPQRPLNPRDLAQQVTMLFLQGIANPPTPVATDGRSTRRASKDGATSASRKHSSRA